MAEARKRKKAAAKRKAAASKRKKAAVRRKAAPKRKKAAVRKKAASKRKKAAVRRKAAPKRKKAAVRKKAAPKRKKAASKRKKAAAPKRRKAAPKRRKAAPKRRKAAAKAMSYNEVRSLLESLLNGLSELLGTERGTAAAPKRGKAAAKKKAAAPKRRKAAASKRRKKGPMSEAHKESIRRGLLIPGCKALSKRFLLSSAHRQVQAVHRDRKSNPPKVADFRRLVKNGKVNLHDGTLTDQDRDKLGQMSIDVPAKHQPAGPRTEFPGLSVSASAS